MGTSACIGPESLAQTRAPQVRHTIVSVRFPNSQCLVSGKLPYTIGKSVNDYPAQVTYNGNGIVPISYNEGLFIDYRHFDAVCFCITAGPANELTDCQANVTPRFEFGFGLSYTTFNYTDLSVTGTTSGGTRQPTNQPGAALDPWSVSYARKFLGEF